MRSPVHKRQGLAAGAVLLLFLSRATTVWANEIKYFRAPVRQVEPSIFLESQPVAKTDFEHESTGLIANFLYKRPASLYYAMAPSGANGKNATWEQNQTGQWYIEQQRAGEVAVIGGLVKGDREAIAAGFKMFDWGFARQAADGSFPGTGDAFHSTSLFLEAVAHTLLVIQQSPMATEYAEQVASYTKKAHRTARWMIQPEVWETGTKHNEPFTHRRYLVAMALGLTAKLTGDRQLMDYARQSISDGLSLQREDGVNPERDGHDSSYQMTGVIYAARWATYFPEEPLTPKVIEMIDKAVAWQRNRILPTGEISSDDNTRTAGQETIRNGRVKIINKREVIRGFAYWASVTDDPTWDAIAHQIAHFYYNYSQAFEQVLRDPDATVRVPEPRPLFGLASAVSALPRSRRKNRA